MRPEQRRKGEGKGERKISEENDAHTETTISLSGMLLMMNVEGMKHHKQCSASTWFEDMQRRRDMVE